MAEQYELDSVEIEQTANLMKQVEEHVLELKRRKWAVEEAEEALRKAQASYDDYSQHVLPDMLKMNGLDMLQMDDGTIVSWVKGNREVGQNGGRPWQNLN